MTVTLVTTVTTLLAPTWNGSQWVRTVASDATILAGDSLVVLVGGGNHVTAFPGGDWQQLDLQTGQEAQGFIMARRFTATPSPASWTVAFDGSDNALVSVLHFRGADVAWEVDAKLRSGAVGVTLPAGSVDITGPGKGDMEFYFAFARNSFGSMPSGDGDALATLSLGNETGALYRDLPTVTGVKHVSLPSRTGHYVVALGVYVPTPGPWRSDSVEFWSGGHPTASLSPSWSSDTADGTDTVDQFSVYYAGASPQDAANHTWGGGGSVTLAPPTGNPHFTLIGPGGSGFDGAWDTQFGALARADGLLSGFTSGELPPTVYDSSSGTYVDPEVRDVEWETAPTPTGQRVRIHAETSMIHAATLDSRAIYYIYAITEPVDGALTPSTFTPPASIKSGSLLATTSIASPLTGAGGTLYTSEDFTYEGGILGSDPTAPLRLRIAAIDHTTETGLAFTPVNDGAAHGAQLSKLTANLEQSYQPQYRLIYRHVPTADTDIAYYGDIPAPYAVTRLWPRDDGYGISATNRIHPRPKANRIIGGYP